MTNPDFYIINHKFRLVCNSIRTDVYPSGLALWIYESTKSLLNGTKKKQYYKPIKMIKIMENNSLSIEDIANMLDDIESVLELEEILNMGCNNP